MFFLFMNVCFSTNQILSDDSSTIVKINNTQVLELNSTETNVLQEIFKGIQKPIEEGETIITITQDENKIRYDLNLSDINIINNTNSDNDNENENDRYVLWNEFNNTLKQYATKNDTQILSNEIENISNNLHNNYIEKNYLDKTFAKKNETTSKEEISELKKTLNEEYYNKAQIDINFIKKEELNKIEENISQISRELKNISLTPGPPGENGKSAYEIYIKNGGKLTEKEWLESLRGEKGDIDWTKTAADNVSFLGKNITVTQKLNYNTGELTSNISVNPDELKVKYQCEKEHKEHSDILLKKDVFSITLNNSMQPERSSAFQLKNEEKAWTTPHANCCLINY
ncbi:hypothetical protein TRFO_42152 [Tritrichomonas foetus]|uniref:Uncharacterized protein n=1 Tax=Tritrichomonas foetus TaxID=1144522 RepID=A0A1J4L209_9EUKA|nr:hypothetical protein TRFO_42152 [Tritrichomonas foetus]|eukprot:OHT15982.1 hypothetical protein TRFO_42152 [Tritrichomonas foetus]